MLTSLLIAPGKADGKAWDGVGRIPEEVFKDMKAGKLRPGPQMLLKALASATNLDVLVPWATNSASDKLAPPDVKATIFVDSKPTDTYPIVADTFSPLWPPQENVLAVSLHERSEIAIYAEDDDAPWSNDRIGYCTLSGIPRFNEHGIIDPAQFHCTGQILGVIMRVQAMRGIAPEAPPPPAASPAPAEPAAPAPPPTRDEAVEEQPVAPVNSVREAAPNDEAPLHPRPFSQTAPPSSMQPSSPSPPQQVYPAAVYETPAYASPPPACPQRVYPPPVYGPSGA